MISHIYFSTHYSQNILNILGCFWAARTVLALLAPIKKELDVALICSMQSNDTACTCILNEYSSTPIISKLLLVFSILFSKLFGNNSPRLTAGGLKLLA